MTRIIKSIGQALYPYGVFRTGKDVYLTFDDGPIPEVTPKVLEILARYDVKATFFMVGENIDKHPEVYLQVVEAGHMVGNHTYNHLKGWDTPFDDYMTNVGQCNKALFVHHPSVFIPTLFRPPYGKATFRQRRALHEEGYKLIYWDVLTRDYDASRTPEAMLKQIQQETRAGSIINFHDSLKSNERMLAVLPQAIEWLQAQGFALSAMEG
ncbi:MAG: polysaccharide deacetylase family protein [Paludibacteraceae bacterium]|nr:polysaccharide deacetylase family protein [Paludibacteraceae bacterium]